MSIPRDRGALIDMMEGTLKMRVDDEEVVFKTYKPLNPPSHYKDLFIITTTGVGWWSLNH